jgi:hypothetical protein
VIIEHSPRWLVDNAIIMHLSDFGMGPKSFCQLNDEEMCIFYFFQIITYEIILKQLFTSGLHLDFYFIDNHLTFASE